MKAAVITVSDSAAAGKRSDESGDLIVESLKKAAFEIIHKEILPDERREIASRIRSMCDEFSADLVVTTGGTGLGPRDVTPEATMDVIDREVPGLAEFLRIEGLKNTPRAALSRARCGQRGRTLIVNLPGSKKAAQESLDALIPLLPHALEMIRGEGHAE